MAQAIIFISHNRVKQGKIEAFRKHYQASIPATFDGKPGTLVQLAYENEESTEVKIIRLFPNADALDLQIQGADERSKKTYDYIEPTSIEIFGTPNPATLENMKKIAGSGVAVKISPNSMGGLFVSKFKEEFHGKDRSDVQIRHMNHSIWKN